MEDQSCNIYFKRKNKPLENFVVRRTNSTTGEVNYRYIRKPLKALLEASLSNPSMPRHLLGASKVGIPVSLYNQSMSVVASNTEYLESLEGFPYEMAIKIWTAAVELKMLDSPGIKTSQTLATFAVAYPDLMLSQLVLSNLFLINDYHTDLLQLLRGTVKLDLSNIGLDDDHDLLKDLKNLENLSILILDKNDLSDVGVRNMVLPFLGANKTMRLEYIDVSNNKLTKKGLQRLTKIQSLKRIVYSPDDFSQKDGEQVLTGFCAKSRPTLEKFQSVGLATELIKRWLAIVRDKRKPMKPKSSFYIKKVIVPRASTEGQVSRTQNRIMFERRQFSKANQTNNLVPNSLMATQKRRRDQDLVLGSKTKIKVKDVKSEEDLKEVNQYEDNLLNIYG